MGNLLCGSSKSADPCCNGKRSSGAEVVHLVDGEPMDNDASQGYSRGHSSTSHHSKSRQEQQKSAAQFVPRKEQKEHKNEERLQENLYEPVKGYGGILRLDDPRKDENKDSDKDTEESSEPDSAGYEQEKHIPTSFVEKEVYAEYEGPAPQILGESYHYGNAFTAPAQEAEYVDEDVPEEDDYREEKTMKSEKSRPYYQHPSEQYEPLYARKMNVPTVVEKKEKKKKCDKSGKSSKKKKQSEYSHGSALGIEGYPEDNGGLEFDNNSSSGSHYTEESEVSEEEEEEDHQVEVRSAKKAAHHQDRKQVPEEELNTIYRPRERKKESKPQIDKWEYETDVQFKDEKRDPYQREVDPYIYLESFVESLFQEDKGLEEDNWLEQQISS